MPETKGRILARSISASDGFASLTPRAALLFVMIIPHLNRHGKLQANPYTVKGTICPKLSYLNVEEIEKLLVEISRKTGLKYFAVKGTSYLHAVNFDQYQDTRKRGRDLLPNWGAGDLEVLANQLTKVVIH